MFWLIALVSSSAQGQVVLSELMYNPAGSEAHDEYVELLNSSLETAVDLKGWRLGDADELDALEDVGKGTLLRPGQFALVLDGSYFGQSIAYGDISSDVLVLTIDDRAFGRGGWSNSKDETVVLLDADGETKDRMRYQPVDRPGYSLEKLHVETAGGLDTWQLGLLPGGTPGLPNSVGLGQVPGSMLVELQITPNPFVRHLIAEYRIPHIPAWANLWIYNIEGDRIRTLLNGTEVGVEGSVEWDGEDNNGRVVGEGLYIVYMET